MKMVSKKRWALVRATGSVVRKFDTREQARYYRANSTPPGSKTQIWDTVRNQAVR